MTVPRSSELKRRIELLGRFWVVVVSYRFAERSHVLDQVEQFGAVLAGERLAKLGAEAADVGSQRLVAVDRRRTRHLGSG